jgi:hypothetical protein
LRHRLLGLRTHSLCCLWVGIATDCAKQRSSSHQTRLFISAFISCWVVVRVLLFVALIVQTAPVTHFFLPLCLVYCNSLLASLNARKAIRGDSQHTGYSLSLQVMDNSSVAVDTPKVCLKTEPNLVCACVFTTLAEVCVGRYRNQGGDNA